MVYNIMTIISYFGGFNLYLFVDLVKSVCPPLSGPHSTIAK